VLCCACTHSLPHSHTCLSLPHSLTHWLTPHTCHSRTHSLPHSLTRCICASFCLSCLLSSRSRRMSSRLAPLLDSRMSMFTFLSPSERQRGGGGRGGGGRGGGREGGGREGGGGERVRRAQGSKATHQSVKLHNIMIVSICRCHVTEQHTRRLNMSECMQVMHVKYVMHVCDASVMHVMHECDASDVCE
jgi:hypothetical protein